jgi:trehalose-6-phosphate synthase
MRRAIRFILALVVGLALVTWAASIVVQHFIQLAAPSRTTIERYRQLNESVEQVAARINERFAETDYRPIVLLRAHHEPPTVFRYYRAADVCYVSSLHDGMNLVAKNSRRPVTTSAVFSY